MGTRRSRMSIFWRNEWAGGVQANRVQDQVKPLVPGKLGSGLLKLGDIDAAVLERSEVRQDQRGDLRLPYLSFVVGQLRDTPHPTHQSRVAVDQVFGDVNVTLIQRGKRSPVFVLAGLQ